MRGLGRIFERPPGSGNLWIAYYHRGRELRESVAKLLGKPNELVTEPDAERALKRRIKEMAGGRFCGPHQDRVTVAEVLDHYERELRTNGTNLRSIRPGSRRFGTASARSASSTSGRRVSRRGATSYSLTVATGPPTNPAPSTARSPISMPH